MAKAASELVVFDLDGTLLNADSEISSSTQETLAALRARGIPYTVATGRARHGAADLLEGLGFDLPQAFKNGVLLWHPLEALYSHHHHLRLEEIRSVLAASRAEGLSPFLATLEPGNVHRIYHAPELNEMEAGPGPSLPRTGPGRPGGPCNLTRRRGNHEHQCPGSPGGGGSPRRRCSALPGARGLRWRCL